jgi:hypothetical protein
MKNQMATFGLALLQIAAFTGCQSPARVEGPPGAASSWQHLVDPQALANARWDTAPAAPGRVEISGDALILVSGNTVTQVPWSFVDMLVEDRTRWYIFPGEGEKKALGESAPEREVVRRP